MTVKPLNPAGYIDSREAARRLGLHRRSVNRLIELRRLPGREVLGKNLIKEEDFEAFREGYTRYAPRVARIARRNGATNGYQPTAGAEASDR